MSFKKLEGLLMKAVLFTSYSFFNKTCLYTLVTQIRKSILTSRKLILKHFPEYISKQLKCHQDMIRSEIGNQLEIILNIFKYKITYSSITCSTIFLLWQLQHFCSFQLTTSTVSLLCSQMCKSYWPLRLSGRTSVLFFLRGQM